ncbi:MAG: hypothetical protein IJ404_05405 [Clostridia bacterium]|nr:hypothetical protein [Clostridia bacterium]
MQNVKVVLPEKFDLVVGDTFQLFFRGIIEAANPYMYDIMAVCEKGHNYPRYFEFTPEKEGTHKLTVTVYDNDKTILASGKTMLYVHEPKKSPEKEVNILCMGDSLTAGGIWPNEAHRRLTATDGTPCGLGLTGFRFIGSKKLGKTGYEGYGGWTWGTYIIRGRERFAAVWIECEHNKTADDQHSTWADEDGNLWQLETIEPDRLKFNRVTHENPKPNAGSVISHAKNAKNADPITVIESSYEISNPFWSDETGGLDFVDYCKKLNVPSIDAVYILLTWNGLWSDHLKPWEFGPSIVEQGKVFVDALHKQYPKAKIKIMGVQVPSLTGGNGANNGAELPYSDDYGLTKFVFALNRCYEEWANEEAYRDFLEFINISGQFDSEYNMPYTEKPVNTRSKVTEMIGTNGVHPSTEGYLQIADAVYRNMVKTFCI